MCERPWTKSKSVVEVHWEKTEYLQIYSSGDSKERALKWNIDEKIADCFFSGLILIFYDYIKYIVIIVIQTPTPLSA